jgi:hypothetical protein
MPLHWGVFIYGGLMAEPTSTGAGFFAGAWLGLTAVLSGMDGMAVLGAISGAAIYTIHSPAESILKRLLYSGISVVVGYGGWQNVAAFMPITGSFFSAFILSAVAVTITTATIDRIKSADVGEMIGKIFNRRN